jgi:hypothetical protein
MDYWLPTGDGTYRKISLYELKDLYDCGKIDLRDVVRVDGRHWLLGEVLGLSLGSTRYGLRGVPLPKPPSVSWWKVAMAAGLTGGYGLAVIGFLQGLWAHKIQRGLQPVLLPLFSLVAVPLHLAWSVGSIIQNHSHPGKAVVQFLIGVLITQTVAIILAIMGSLSVRKSLLRRLESEGFQMSWLLTVTCGAIYVAYKMDELRETCY